MGKYSHVNRLNGRPTSIGRSRIAQSLLSRIREFDCEEAVHSESGAKHANTVHDFDQISVPLLYACKCCEF